MGGAGRVPGAANNTRVTWSRNANGTINRFKTLENINLRLTQAQRNALLEMSENKAMNTIRQLARQK
jgi:antibiotic biosynthesis monooxygenase (ABM) superfamily enzyme